MKYVNLILIIGVLLFSISCDKEEEVWNIKVLVTDRGNPGQNIKVGLASSTTNLDHNLYEQETITNSAGEAVFSIIKNKEYYVEAETLINNIPFYDKISLTSGGNVSELKLEIRKAVLVPLRVDISNENDFNTINESIEFVYNDQDKLEKTMIDYPDPNTIGNIFTYTYNDDGSLKRINYDSDFHYVDFFYKPDKIIADIRYSAGFDPIILDSLYFNEVGKLIKKTTSHSKNTNLDEKTSFYYLDDEIGMVLSSWKSNNNEFLNESYTHDSGKNPYGKDRNSLLIYMYGMRIPLETWNILSPHNIVRVNGFRFREYSINYEYEYPISFITSRSINKIKYNITYAWK